MAEEVDNKDKPGTDDGGGKPEEKPEPSDSPSGTGGGSGEEKSLIDQLIDEKKELSKIRDDIKKQNDRTEKLRVDAEIAGKGSFGLPKPVKKKLTDSEYAEAFEKGEVDPFKEDGF